MAVAMEQPKKTKTFILSVFLCVFAGSFQYGYNISSVNGPANAVKDLLYGKLSNETQYIFGRERGQDYEGDSGFIPVDSCGDITSANTDTGIADCEECGKDGKYDCQFRFVDQELQAAQQKLTSDRENQFATAVAIFTIGGIIGSFSVKFLVTKFGRKGAQAINMVISIAAAANFIGAKHFESNACLLVARILIGLFAGLATGVCPMYIMELSSTEDRGWIGVMNQLFITIGILVAQIISLPAVMGDPELWGLFMSLTAIPAIVWLLGYGISVESPRYILIEQNKEEDAKETLIKVRGTNDVASEMNQMREEARRAAEETNMSVLELFRSKEVRWQLISICLMMLSQQLSGINAVFFYTNIIFESAGFDNATSTNITVGIGLLNVIMTLVSMALMDKAGRKTLMVYGYGIMIFFCVAMTIVLQNLNSTTWMPYLSIVCVMGYIVGFAIGPGPVPWIWNTEFFKQSARAGGGTISCVINWTCTALVGKFFPPIQLAIGPYVFVFFAAICTVAFLFIIKFIPETKGKEFEEIERDFAKLNGVEPKGLLNDEEKQDNRTDLL